MGVPAQTTAHHAKSIWRTQFSTAGQNEVFSSGCELNILSGAELEVDGRAEFVSGGELELEAGSTMNIETGASVKVQGGAVLNFSSAATLALSSGAILNRGDFHISTGVGTGESTLPAHGISVITSTRKHTYELSAPYKGAYKKIIFIPSSGEHITKVKVDSATGAGWKRHIGSTKAAFGRPTVINVQTSGVAAFRHGASIDLLGMSTNRWIIASMHASSNFEWLSLTTST